MLPIGAALTVAYVALEWVGSIHEYKGLLVTPWNPGVGTLYAAMIGLGLWNGFALFAGIVAADLLFLQDASDWPDLLVTAALAAVAYALAAAVARRLGTPLERLRGVLVLLASGIAGAVAVAALLSGFLVASGRLQIEELADSTLPMLVGDILGIAVMAPLLLRFGVAMPAATPSLLEVALIVLALAASLWAIFAGGDPAGHALFYLLFLPVVVAALRHGLDGACLSLAATQLGLIGALHFAGFDAPTFTEYQLLMFVLTATGLVVGVTVSERRHAERRYRDAAARLREKEAEVAQAMRFNLASGMAGALAHEINQPLTAARASARSAQQVMRTAGGDVARADGFLTTMVAQIDHAAAVVRRMRDFLRRGDPLRVPVDVQAMLEEALALIRADAAEREVALALDVPAGLPPVPGDSVQLEQVILNLVRNALEALGEKPRADARIAIAARLLHEPSRIEISVADNGPGIAPEIAERMFAPLVTSKAASLGLGLAVCAAIVEAHGGRLWLHRTAPGATEFRLSLPTGAS